MGAKTCPQCKHRFSAKYFCTKCGCFVDAHDIPYSWKQLERKAKVILSRVNFETTELISKEDAVIELIIAAKSMDGKEYKHYKKGMQYTVMRNTALYIMERSQSDKVVIDEHQRRLDLHHDVIAQREKTGAKVHDTLCELRKEEQDILRMSFDFDHQGKSLFKRCERDRNKYKPMQEKRKLALEAFKEKFNEV